MFLPRPLSYNRGDGSAVIPGGGGAPLCYNRGDGSAVIPGWPCYTRGDGSAARGVPDPVLELFLQPKCGLPCFSWASPASPPAFPSYLRSLHSSLHAIHYTLRTVEHNLAYSSLAITTAAIVRTESFSNIWFAPGVPASGLRPLETRYYKVLHSTTKYYKVLRNTTTYYEGLRTTYLGYRKWKLN